MFNDKSKPIKKAGPATPVEILGIDDVPSAGDVLVVATSEKEARARASKRQEEEKLTQAAAKHLSLANLYSQVRDGEVKGLNVILKTDVQGSIEPIKTSLERLNTEEVQVNILHADSGSITESDVLLALASEGIILGFNTSVEPGANQLADNEGIYIRQYDVIYNLVDDVEKAVKGMLEPTYVDVVEGHGEVRAIFSIRGAKVAGVYITDGKATRGSRARILRNGEEVFESSVGSLKRFKDDVKEVASGYECGVGIEGTDDIEEGDIIEFYRKEMV